MSRLFMMTGDKWRKRDWLLLILFAILCIYGLATDAQIERRWMVLYQGAAGLHFECVDELPYQIDRAMVWDDERGAIEISGYGTLIAQVVEVGECNLDNIYRYDGNYYAWLFTTHQTDEHPNHRHISRGAWWIDWSGV